MVNSFLHTVPPVPSYSQISSYHLDGEEIIDNEKLSSSFSSVQNQEHHELATTKTTTSIRNQFALADPFVLVEDIWSTYNNTANYINMIQSLRNIILFWMDIRHHSDDIINAPCSSSHQRRQQKYDFTNSSTRINVKQRPVKTVTAENNIDYYSDSNNNNDSIGRKRNLSLAVNDQRNIDSIMAVPLYRGCSPQNKTSKNNSESHNHWLWSILSSKNKMEGDGSDNDENTDGIVIYCQATMRRPAQQKQPLWTCTHSYLRDTRINSAELRMISAEQNMIRNSKITRPLKNRQYQQRRKDGFVWAQRSCLRIVYNVGEIHK